MSDVVRWNWPFTCADAAIIEAMDERTRDAVERYLRQTTTSAASLADADEESEYERGWRDGCDAMESELQSIYVPPPPTRKQKAAP